MRFREQAVGQIPWGHITVLLDKVHDQATRDWYAAAVTEHGWSRKVLLHQIMNRTHERIGSAPSNFADRLPAPDSELARDLARDPYVFDFLGLSGRVSERQLEQALIDRLQQTLSEFGHGFAFVGRQYHLDVGGDDFYIDLLFFHMFQLRFVVVELKIDQFRPEYAGKLGFYVAAVDEQIRDKTKHGPTVGLLLCAGSNELIVRYSLANTTAPVAVSEYTYDTLPSSERDLLPSEDEVAHALEAPLPVEGQQMTLDEYLEELRRTGELADEQVNDGTQ